MVDARWTERVEPGGGALEILVDAIDAEQTEQLEMASFRHALSAPAKEHEVVVTRANGTKSSSLGGLGLIVVAVCVFSTFAFVGGFGSLAKWLGFPLSFESLIFVMVAGFLAPILALKFHYRQRRTAVAKVRDRFTLTLDAAGFELRGSKASRKYELAMIDRFEGERRVVLVSKDGRREAMPLLLGSAGENAALANRLNDALVEARAGGAGYRGAGPRVATEATDDVEEAPSSDRLLGKVTDESS